MRVPFNYNNFSQLRSYINGNLTNNPPGSQMHPELKDSFGNTIFTKFCRTFILQTVESQGEDCHSHHKVEDLDPASAFNDVESLSVKGIPPKSHLLDGKSRTQWHNAQKWPACSEHRQEERVNSSHGMKACALKRRTNAAEVLFTSHVDPLTDLKPTKPAWLAMHALKGITKSTAWTSSLMSSSLSLSVGMAGKYFATSNELKAMHYQRCTAYC